MKKKNVGILFLKLFLKSFIVIMLLLLVGVGSYQLTMMYFKTTDADVQGEDRFLDIVGDVTAGEVSLNLIYKASEDGEKIKGLVLEIFNTGTHNLDYITIPETTRFTISNEMYQRISVVSPEAPQIVQMSRLKEYFNGEASNKDVAYEYGIILLEDYFGIDIGYYTVMKETAFDAFFEKKEGGAYTISSQTIEEMDALTDEKEWERYIKEKYELATSNLKVKQKVKYAPALAGLQTDKVYAHMVTGEEVNGAFEANVQEMKQLYNRILGQATYKVSQDEAKDVEGSSVGRSIVILNGTGVTGLAASFQEKLKKDGYTVDAIGDYTEGMMETTKIFVRKKSMGKDLLGYFNQAEIETKKLDKGVDIQVVLGKADAPP